MKAINFGSKILALLLGLGALVLFFFPFVSFVIETKAVDATGAQLAFGSTLIEKYDLANSLYMLLTFIFTALATLTAGVAIGVKKSVPARIVSFVSALVGGIIMLVIALSKVTAFTDTRTAPIAYIENLGKLSYSMMPIIIAVLLFACAIIGIIGWLVNDYLEVLASKGQKLTIFQKIKKFFREMWAEIKKIVWPSRSSILRNCIIVLVICLLIGAFIWCIDWLLGMLVDYIASL